VNAQTTLQGNATGANLQLIQKGSGAGLALVVAKGKAPITVNSAAGKARNLNADKLDSLDSTAFAGGGGKFFTAHVAFAQSDSPKDIVNVPRLATMKASWDGGTITFSLKNTTGGTVEMTYSEFNVADGMSIANNGDILLGQVQSSYNNTAEVQIAWGSGASRHFVHMTISWFIQEAPGPHVMVFGYAR
jgi:hypothetical protein